MLLIKNRELVLKKFSGTNIMLTPNGGQVVLLTGGIASGKTSTLNSLQSYGFATFNTDAVIKNIMQSDISVIQEVSDNFPECRISKNKKLHYENSIIDRVKLSNIVLLNLAKRQQLENILYKHIRSVRIDFIKEVRKIYGTSKSVVIEIPMLFEKLNTFPEQFYPIFAFTKQCLIVSTISSIEIRCERVMRRKNMTKEKFFAILATQVSDDYRVNFSDHLIYTVGALSKTQLSIRGIVQL